MSKLSITNFTTFLVLLLVVGSTAFNVSPIWTRRNSSSLHMTKLSYNGKKIDVRAGTPLKNAIPKLGIKPRYSCKK